MNSLRFLLLLLLAFGIACTPVRRGSNGGGGGDDDDSAGDDDDDATGDDDDATGGDDDATGDDDDATGDDDDATGDDDDAAPLSNPNDIIGNTYSLDLANATWVQPPGVGSLLSAFLEGTLAVSPLSTSSLGSGYVELRIGTWTDSGNQDECAITEDADGDWINPLADVGPTTMQFGAFPLQDGVIAPVFGSATSIIDGTFGGTIDARDIYLEAGMESPQEVCDLFSQTLGVPCVPCSDGQQLCIDLLVEDLTGSRVSTSALYEVTQDCE